MSYKAMSTAPSTQSKGGEAHLWVCSGKNIGRRFALDQASQHIGRSPDVEIPVLDERVSSQHARIDLRDGRHLLVDLRSTNGTFVNNQRVSEAVLRDGDLIQVGETVFEYLSYEERNLTINVPSSDSSTDRGDAVPEALRAGAQQMLMRARVEPSLAAPQPPAPAAPPNNPPQNFPSPPYAPVPSGVGPVPILSGVMPPPNLPMLPEGGIDPNMVRALHRPAQSMPPMVPMQPAPLGFPGYETRSATVMEDEDEEGGGKGIDIQALLAKARIVLGILKPYWPILLVLFILGGGLGAYTMFLKPPLRMAVFEMSLTPAPTDNPLGERRTTIQFFRSAAQNFRSSSLISKTLSELGVEDPSPELVSLVQGRLEFASLGPPVPNTYVGSYQAPSGEEAVKFLETHVKLYLDSEIDKTLKVIKAEADFLAERLAETEKELRRTESELLEFKKENIEGLPDQAEQYYGLLFELQRQEAEASMKINELSAQYKMSNTRIRSENPLEVYQERQSRPFDDAINEITRQLATARAAGKDAEHPEVVEMERRLAEMRKLAKESEKNSRDVTRRRNPVYDSIQGELYRLEAERQAAGANAGRIRQEIKKIRDIVDRLPELEATFSELTRSYESNRNLHGRIFEELKRSQLQLELEKAQAAARYDIITPPNLEFFPFGKKVVTRAIAGGMGGLFLGLFFVGAREAKKRNLLAKYLNPQPPTDGGSALVPRNE